MEGTESVPTSEPSAEIINCGCGSTEEEGLMLQVGDEACNISDDNKTIQCYS